nr:hypothetical protein [Tanacetum cinerariifolium]
MTDYSLWKVILNGDSPIPTKVLDGVVQPVALAKKKELKARGTLLMALPDKHQLKFNIHKDAKSLMEAIENSTNESVSAITSVSAASTKVLVFALPNVDNLSDAVIYTFFARRNLGANRTTSIGFDISKVECYNCHRRRHFARECRSPRDTRNKDTQRRNVPVETSTSNALVSQCDGVAPCSKACSKAYATLKSHYDKLANYLRKSQFDVLSYKTSLESVEARLVVYQQNENVFEEDIRLLKLDVMLRDKALVELRNKFEKVKQEGDDDELSSSKSHVRMSTSLVDDRYKSGYGYHNVPPPYTGTFMPPKSDLVFHDALTANETVLTVLNVEPSTTKPNKDLSQSNKPSTLIIEDWVSDSEDETEGEPLPTQKAPCFVQISEHVKTPRLSVKPDNDYYEKKMVQKSVRNHAMRANPQHSARMTHTLPNRHVVPTVVLTRSRLVPLNAARPVTTAVIKTNVKHHMPAKQVNAIEGVKGNWVWKPKCLVLDHVSRQTSASMTVKQFDYTDALGRSKHTTGNISYLSNFEEINKGYVSFGENPKGGKITGKVRKEAKSVQQYVLLPLWYFRSKDPHNTDATAFEVKEPESAVHVSLSSCDKPKKHDDKTKRKAKGKIPCCWSSNNAVSSNFKLKGKSSYVDPSQYPDDPDMPALEDITYSDDKEDVGAEADFSNLETNINVSPTPTTRVHKDHHVTKIIGDLSSAPQTRSMARMAKEQGGLTQINDDDFHTCMFAYFLSQEEPKRGEGIDYEEVFAPVARIEAIRLFLAYASFMGFMVYQMDIKSDFLYGTIEEEVYVCQPSGFKDPNYPDKVYKVVKALYGLHQAPRACQDKYVAKILRKFGLTDRKSASTPIDIEKPLLKDPDGEDVDAHTYRSMIGSLMYLTSSRPDIMFVVCACACFQVTPKALHLHVVKRIFRYLKGKPHLSLWYPKDSPFNLVAYSDSDYAGASLDRKSTTGGCQFLAAASCCAKVLWIQNQLLDYRRVGKGFLGADTPLFAEMLVPQQAQEVEDDAKAEDDVNEVSDEPTPPSHTPATPPPPPQQEHIPLTPQADTAPSSPPPQPRH